MQNVPPVENINDSALKAILKYLEFLTPSMLGIER